MNTCKACGGNFDRSEKCVLCSGFCGKVFHPGCVGLNVTNFKAWTANVGLLWFCETCRVNFNPTVMNREAVIMKTMRDLLLRVDSLDLRVGQFGENLKTLNGFLSMSTSARRESNISTRLQQFLASGAAMNDSSDFYNSIDRFNLDSSLLSNAANNTIVDADELSILTSVNDVMGAATITEATVTSAMTTTCAATATSNVINATPATTTTAVTTTTVNGATTATAAPITATATTINTVAPTASAASTALAASTDPAASAPPAPVASTSGLNNRPSPDNPSADDNCRLKVVSKTRLRIRRQSIDSLKSFYVTPFHNEQTEEDIIDYLREVTNTDTSRINCVKLVPRNKNIEECTFVSFKLSVSDDLASIVGDAFYWPEGVEVREFRPKNDKVQISIKPT